MGMSTRKLHNLHLVMEYLVLNEERGMVFMLPTVISGAGDPGQKPWFYFWWKGKKENCCSQMTLTKSKVTSSFRISQESRLSFLCELLPWGRAYLRGGWMIASCLLSGLVPAAPEPQVTPKSCKPRLPEERKSRPHKSRLTSSEEKQWGTGGRSRQAHTPLWNGG